MEEGTHKYEIGKAQKNPIGMGGRYQCDLLTSNMCMYIQYAYVWVRVCVCVFFLAMAAKKA